MAHRLLFLAFWLLQPEGAVFCTFSLARCLKNFNKGEFKRAGCVLKLPSAQPRSIIQLLYFSQLWKEAVPQEDAQTCEQGRCLSHCSFSWRPARSEGLQLSDPVKQDGNRLEFTFIGVSSMACLFCASYAAPSPSPAPFSQASYFLRVWAPLGCKFHQVRAHILLLSRNPVMRFLARSWCSVSGIRCSAIAGWVVEAQEMHV